MLSPHAGPSDDEVVDRPVPAPAPSGARADVQGLRAVAVLLVVADHLWGEPRGGFLGVDVFFVLSGFLITGLLLREHGRHDRISFADFYRRRVRRIVPAATLVLVVTVVATYLVFNSGRGEQVARDGAWAFGFLANWHFLHEGTDYFLAAGPVSPLQHYWSLSVEEQFYVVWPALLLGLLWLTRRTGRAVLPLLVGGLGVLLFGYSLHHSSAEPVAAYFSTFDRAWELLAGALLAATAHRLSAIPDRLRPLLAWAGLAMIAAAVLVVSDTSTFPAPWAALPVAGAVLVLASGTGPRTARNPLLENPVSRYVGDISYSLYLWHFPVIVLLAAYFPDGGVASYVAAIVLMGALSVASYHLVENPVRHSQWLEPRANRVNKARSYRQRARLANGYLAVAALVTIPLVLAAVSPPTSGPEQEILDAAPPAPVSGEPTPGGTEPVGTETPTAADYLQDRISQTLGLEAFPELEPPVEDLGITRWYDEMKSSGCLSVPPADVESCTFGPEDAKHTAAVIGDSFAIAYMPAVREALESSFRIHQLTLQECPVWDAVTEHSDGSAYPECTDYRKFVWEQVAELKPDVLILATSWRDGGLLASGADGPGAVQEILAGYERSLAQLVPSAELTVVLEPPAGSVDLQTCVTKVGSPADCFAEPSAVWEAVVEQERSVAERSGAVYVDTARWFCSADRCPAFVGRTPAYADGTHLTLQYARELGPAMHEALVAAADELQQRDDG